MRPEGKYLTGSHAQSREHRTGPQPMSGLTPKPRVCPLTYSGQVWLEK